ncbi:DMT family transporter [Chondromyces crocatus]|uniref:Permease n=1 Tax=Chondromyces crocatus TaxID=52 RepID=A0A0K1E596_CHOCO|nr:DMT family transporter [Chondromyces crocatus]AKT36019.1 permease [Chondromyces crocatus]
MQPVTARSAVLFLLIASAAFAVSGPFARAARPVHPLVIAAGRVALAALVLGLVNARAMRRALPTLTPRQRAHVFGAGALLAAHFALFQWGLDRTSLPAALSLVALEPLAVVVWAWVLFGIRPTRPEQLGLSLATIGALVVARGAGSGEHRVEGDLLVLGAVVLYGAYVAAARGIRDALPAHAYAAFVYTGASLSLLLALPLIPGALATASPLPQHAAVYILLLALIPTLIGHTAVQWAARRMSPSIVALVSTGETLGGITVGALWLGTIPNPSEIAGGLFILAGTTLAILASRGTESPSSA